MSENAGLLAHLTVIDRAQDRSFHRRGRGDSRIRDVERRAHGDKLRDDMETSFAEADTERAAGRTLVRTPSDPSFDNWTPLASEGDISPHSRTSLLFGPRL